MPKHPRWQIWLAGLTTLFLVGQLFFLPKVYVNSKIVTALQAPFIFFRSVVIREKINQQLTDLQLENQGLRAQIEILNDRPEFIQEERKIFLRAKIYSNYPTNNANQILVNAGEEAGVKIGMVALAEPGIFLGEVIRVDGKISVIRTIFDPDWELLVKIGTGKADALLISGVLPKLTLISKNKNIDIGSPVYLTDKRYSYGLMVGSVSEVEISDNQRFNSALIRTPYIRNDLDEVYIQLDN